MVSISDIAIHIQANMIRPDPLCQHRFGERYSQINGVSSLNCLECQLCGGTLHIDDAVDVINLIYKEKKD